MNRTEFLAALAAKLVDVTDDERDEAIQYYNEYLDEAGAENEESAIAELGSPEKVANIIRANCGFSLKSTPKAPLKPELTLDGPAYGTPQTDANAAAPQTDNANAVQDAPPTQNNAATGASYVRTPGSGYQYAGNRSGSGGGNNSNSIILIVVLVLTFPIWIGLLGGLFGLVVGLLAAVFALIVSGFAVLVSGIVVFITSIGLLIASPANGLVTMGIALLCIAIGAILSAGSLWCIAKGAPTVIRATVNLVQALLRKVGLR